MIGGNLIVDNAVKIAIAWNVRESVIGVTIVALGTPLPELATSAIAAKRKCRYRHRQHYRLEHFQYLFCAGHQRRHTTTPNLSQFLA